MTVFAPNCLRCSKPHQAGEPQWTCCYTHTPEVGVDWVCDACAVILHPEKAAIVTHLMPNRDYVLPCCGVLQWEAPQTDRVSLGPAVPVTCSGKKRYRPKEESSGANRAERRAAAKHQRR